MGSKSSKWLVGLFTAAVLALAPAGAVASLDYSRNSVDGHYLAVQSRPVPNANDIYSPSAAPARPLPQINDVSVPAGGSRVPSAVPAVNPGSGFSWGDALAGAGVALMLAFGATVLVRRRHASPLAG
jgi:hypothetical protein